MISSLKNSLKDQIQFSLILFTGLFAGSIFTLIYIKLWEQGDVTFADIGGMLAGVGTMGLLYIAIKTTHSWREQLNEAAKKESLDQFYETSLLAHLSLIQHIADLKKFKEQNTKTLKVHIKANNRQKIETTTKHNVTTSKLRIHWNDLVIPGTTPMDLINLYKEFDSLFCQNATNEAYDKALNLCIDFQQKCTDAYFHYGSTLVNKS